MFLLHSKTIDRSFGDTPSLMAWMGGTCQIVSFSRLVDMAGRRANRSYKIHFEGIERRACGILYMENEIRERRKLCGND